MLLLERDDGGNYPFLFDFYGQVPKETALLLPSTGSDGVRLTLAGHSHFIKPSLAPKQVHEAGLGSPFLWFQQRFKIGAGQLMRDR
jgi:hypothetical protein